MQQQPKYVTLPKFQAIGQTLVEIWLSFFVFKMSAVGHLGFLKVGIFTAGTVRRTKLRHRAKFHTDRSNRCRDMAFSIFKMAYWLYESLDHPRRAFGGLCHCAKFVWNRCCSFNNMQVLILPIQAPFSGFWGLWTLNGE